jgi:hypothetical protein
MATVPAVAKQVAVEDVLRVRVAPVFGDDGGNAKAFH